MRIHVQPLGQAVDHPAEDEVELRVAHPAHHAAGDLVGVDGVRFHLDVGDRRQRHFGDLRRGELQREDRVVGVRADVADGLEVERGDRAVGLGAHLAVVERRLPGVVEAVPPRVLELHRPAGLLCQQRGEEEERLVAGVAAAELPADVLADDPHLVDRQLQHLADVHPGLVRRVGVGHDRQPVIFPLRQAAPGVQRALRRVVMAGVHLDDDIRRGKALLHVALGQEDIRAADRIGRQARCVAAICGWITGAPGCIAASGSSTKGSTSHSTSTSRSACSAICSLSAATATPTSSPAQVA